MDTPDQGHIVGSQWYLCLAMQTGLPVLVQTTNNDNGTDLVYEGQEITCGKVKWNVSFGGKAHG